MKRKIWKYITLMSILTGVACVSACEIMLGDSVQSVNSSMVESSQSVTEEEVHTHSWESFEVVVDASCENKGTIIYKCACGQIDVQTTDPLGHVFTQYQQILLSDIENNTETAYCDRNCGKSHTRPLENATPSDPEPDSAQYYTFLVKYADGTAVGDGYNVQLCVVNESGALGLCLRPIEVVNGVCVYNITNITQPGIYEAHVLDEEYNTVELVSAVRTSADAFGEYTLTIAEDNSTPEEPEDPTPEEPTPEEPTPEDTELGYTVKVQNAGGYCFNGLSVSLKNNDEVIATALTEEDGVATFDAEMISVLGEYTIEVTPPIGYVVNGTYSTEAVDDTEVVVEITPTGVMKGSAPSGTRYQLGDVMYDFTVQTTDGSYFTLSEALKEKDMVLINFWATWCGPCKMEFPAMNAAYEQMKDDVAVIAISTEPTDSTSKVSDFKAQNGLLFDMASYGNGEAVASCFDTSLIPVLIMVDRYGVIVYYRVCSMTAATDFTSRFSRLVGDDYKPTVLRDGAEDEGENEDGSGDILIRPTVEFPDLEDVEDVLVNSGDFTFKWDTQDVYAWPWVIKENDNGDNVVQASVKLDGNHATLKATFNVQEGDTFLFDYDVLTEDGYDILYVVMDEVTIYKLSGRQSGTASYVFRDFEAGEHTVYFIYVKDVDTSIFGEYVNISNFRLETTDENAEGLACLHAVNVVNVDEEGNLLDPTKNSYYQHYETVVLNEEDGYYHVGTEDGPILFACLMWNSRWSDTSVWLLAYNDLIIVDGYNYHSDIENFAWLSNQPIPNYAITHGYAPVTAELQRLLDLAAKSNLVKENGDKYWTGDYHENEWLEMCVYWQNYGDTPALEDPMKTISFHAAEQVYAGENGSVENTAKLFYAMDNGGFKYKFIPEKSGVYNVYSTGDEDTSCFLVAEDRITCLGEYTEVIGRNQMVNGQTVPDLNFCFHYYFEEGKTYYLLMNTYIPSGYTEYPFYIDYVGDEYSYLENVAVGPYSYYEDEGESSLFLTDAKDCVYEESEDAYYVVDKDGNKCGKIYLDMMRGTALFPSHSLYQVAIKALDYPIEKRAFYIDGVDYSETLAIAGFFSQNNEGMFYGYTPLTKELFETIYTITTSEKYDGLDNTWQLLCYYYRTLNAETK